MKSTATCAAGGLEGAEVVADVDLRDELETGRLLDAAADRGADLAAGAQHAHPDRLAHLPNLAGDTAATPERAVPGFWQAGGMSKQPIPPRIKWAVDLMDPQPSDSVLEIGCGAGAGAELICERLETGKLFAIDRSESGVDRTKRRCAKYVEAGRLTVRQIDLATLRVPVKRLNKVFAFNVNLFWVRKCDDEVALLHERVLPGGAVYLYYEANRPELIPNIVTKASKALTDGGFRVSLVEQKAPPVVAIIGKR